MPLKGVLSPARTAEYRRLRIPAVANKAWFGRSMGALVSALLSGTGRWRATRGSDWSDGVTFEFDLGEPRVPNPPTQTHPCPNQHALHHSPHKRPPNIHTTPTPTPTTRHSPDDHPPRRPSDIHPTLAQSRLSDHPTSIHPCPAIPSHTQTYPPIPTWDRPSLARFRPKPTEICPESAKNWPGTRRLFAISTYFDFE